MSERYDAANQPVQLAGKSGSCTARRLRSARSLRRPPTRQRWREMRALAEATGLPLQARLMS